MWNGEAMDSIEISYLWGFPDLEERLTHYFSKQRSKRISSLSPPVGMRSLSGLRGKKALISNRTNTIVPIS